MPGGDGIFSGMKEEPVEITVMTKEGVIAVRSYKRRSEEERRNFDQLSGVKGSPWEPALGTRRIDFKSRIGISQGEDGRQFAETGVTESNSRRICITKADVDKYKIAP